MLLVRELCLRLFQPVEGFWRLWIACLIWMDKQRLLAVCVLDVRLGDTRQQTEDGVAEGDCQ